MIILIEHVFFRLYIFFRYEVRLMKDDEHTILSRIRYPDRNVEHIYTNQRSEVMNYIYGEVSI